MDQLALNQKRKEIAQAKGKASKKTEIPEPDEPPNDDDVPDDPQEDPEASKEAGDDEKPTRGRGRGRRGRGGRGGRGSRGGRSRASMKRPAAAVPLSKEEDEEDEEAHDEQEKCETPAKSPVNPGRRLKVRFTPKKRSPKAKASPKKKPTPKKKKNKPPGTRSEERLSILSGMLLMFVCLASSS